MQLKRHHNKNLNMDSYEKKNASPSPHQQHLFYTMCTTALTPTANLETTSKHTRFDIQCTYFVTHLNHHDFYFSFKNVLMKPAWLLVLLTLILQRTKLSSALGTVSNVPENIKLYLPCQHGVQKNTKRPDVTRCIITLPLQDFWCHKIGCITWRHKETILCS